MQHYMHVNSQWCDKAMQMTHLTPSEVTIRCKPVGPWAAPIMFLLTPMC